MRSFLRPLIASLGLSLALLAHAEHKDPAPIPDEVVERVAHRPMLRRDPLPAMLDATMSESRRQLHRLGQDTGAGPDGSAAAGGESQVVIEALLAQTRMLREQVVARVKAADAQNKPAKAKKAKKTAPSSEVATLAARAEVRFDRLETALSAVRDAADPTLRRGAITRALMLLDEYHGRREARDQGIEPRAMPGFHRDKPSAHKPLPDAQTLPAYLSQENTRPGSHVYAYNGDIMLAAAPLSVPANAQEECGYQAADLQADGKDVVLTDEIKKLAEALGYSPARIYRHVYNTIRFQPYWGAVKGAQGALTSSAGNATDQASLLIALLRASNIPARYVKGVIEIRDTAPAGKDGRVNRWLGAKEYIGAYTMLFRGGYPSSSDSSSELALLTNADGQRNGVRLTHVWVEACVPYAHYRGVRMSDGGHRWVPLDASFKDNVTAQEGMAVSTTFNFDTYLAKRVNGADSLPQEILSKDLAAAARSVDPAASAEDIPYQVKTTASPVELLPSSLPYYVKTHKAWGGGITASETASLPDTHRMALQVKIANGVSLSKTLYLRELFDQRLTLSYKGATPADQTTLDNWRRSVDGDGQPDLAASKPCPLSVVPSLRLEGTEVATGSQVVDLCSEDNLLTLSLQLGELATPEIKMAENNHIKAAAWEALFVNAFQTVDGVLQGRAKKLFDAVRATANPNTDPDATLGEYLHLSGLKYMRYMDDAIRRIGTLHGESGLTGHHLGITAAVSKVEYLFDLPYALNQLQGFLVDFPSASFRSVNLTDGSDESAQSSRLMGLAASLYESFIWQENARFDSISTVRGIQYSNELYANGTHPEHEVLTLTSANWAAQSGKLTSNADPAYNYGAATVSYIKTQFIDNGDTVTLPRRLIQYDNWKGFVVMAENPTLGSAAYQISGGYNGGWTVGTPVNYNFNPILNTGYSFAQLSQPTTVYTAPPAVVSPAINYGASPHITYGADPVNLVTGNLYHTETDVSIPGRGGLGLAFERHYNSRKAVDGPLGYGWSHSYQHALEFRDDNYNGIDEAADTDGAVSSAVWIDGTGAEKHIGMSVGTSSTSFTPPKGFHFTVAKTAAGYLLTEPNGLAYTFADAAVALGGQARLDKVTDRNGNTVALTYDASGRLSKVADPAGRELVLDYQGGTRIRTVTDWTGRAFEYRYDGNGDLVEYLNPLARAGQQPGVQYAYHSAADGQNLAHALKRYTLARGNGMDYAYYANGRMFRHTTFPANEATAFAYNDFRRETVMVNPRGLTRRVFFDRHGNPVKEETENGAISTFEYDASDPYLKRAETDPLGQRTQYEYHPDGKGNLKKTTLPSQLKTAGVNDSVQYEDYTVHGRPQRVKDARGNWTLLAYDAKGNLSDEIRTSAGYTPTAGATPPTANILTWSKFAYDSYGNRSQRARLRSFSGHSLGVFPASVAGPTLITEYAASANHPAGTYATRVTRQGDRDGDGDYDAADPDDIADLSHDSLGRLTAGIDADWQPVSQTWDAVDRVVSHTDPLGQTRVYRYDANGNLEEEQLPGVTRQAFGYDRSDRQAFVLDNTGAASRSEYDAAGNAIQLTDPDGYRLGFEFDAGNRWVVATDQEGNSVTRGLDVAGRVRTVTDPEGHTTQYAWHAATAGGGLKSVTRPQVTGFAQGRQMAYTHDANGNIIQVKETAAGGDTWRYWLSTYDELDRATREVGPEYIDASLGNIRPVTQYVYDALGRVTQVKAGRTDSTGAASADTDLVTQASYVYDDFGRRLKETDPLNKTWTWSWDRHGNVLTRTDARTQKTEYLWDPGHQLKQKTVRNADASVWRTTTTTRNALGQATRIEARDGAGTLVIAHDYGYDPAHRLNSVSDSRGNKTLNYAYSPGGLLDKKEDSDGHRSDYLYDAVGRLTGIWAPNYDYVAFSHDKAGRPVQKWLPNGDTADYSWNADGSLSEVDNLVGGARISRHTYTYDGYGRRQEETSIQAGYSPATLKWRHQYDELDRLVNVEVDPGSGYQGYQSWRHDVRGNLTRRYYATANGSYTARYLTDAGHRLTGVDLYNAADTTKLGAQAFLTWDANGSLTGKTTSTGSLTLAWDPEGHLATASTTGAGALSQSYLYDEQGRRIQKTSGTTTTNYLYDGEDIQAEYTTWANPQAVYVHGAGSDEPLLRLTGETAAPTAGALYYHADGLGSVVAASDAAGLVTGKARYTAWGIELNAATGLPQYGYTGREPDETGLMYYRARYYDRNALGVPGYRFTARDPAGLAGGLNPYAYCENDPVNCTDPTGMVPKAINPFGDYSTFSGLSTSSPAVVSSGRSNLASIGNSAGSAVKQWWDSSVAGFQSDSLGGFANKALQGSPVGQEFAAIGVGVKAGVSLAGGVGLALKGVHKNSLDYVGDTHVYRIIGPQGTHKIGESAQGVRVSDGASIRAEQQVRKLTKETGEFYTSEVRKTFPDKRTAREYETPLIERFRSMFGQEALPGNKTNR
ncbi:MAG: RHS repeat-associated core domain-containing protein [Pseudomonadota bacterium]|nr:RHS repeat-associated core domain-containing protein [Pseudomonadota bacterium]